MRRDAELGAAGDPGRAENRHLIGVARLLAGEDEAADDAFADAARIARTNGGSAVAILSLSERALLALGRGDLGSAEGYIREARAWIEEADVDGYTANALLHAAAARTAFRRGDLTSVRADLVAAQRVRPQLTEAIPWFSVQVRLELARTYLALAERETALVLLSEARDVLRVRPDLGVLGDRVQELITHTAAIDDPVAVAWASSLTVAELRLLPLLTTHLTFREIAERLYVSRNTVKTQAISMYRKLGVSSRSEAIGRAVELGLIEG
jgi:LuxR family maltose regulon positive regulatory protein